MAPKKRARFDNPAAAALRTGRAFQDLRVSNEQLTTERLIAEAQELQHFSVGGVDRQKGPAMLHITSKEELALYRQKTRHDFEFHVKRSYSDFGSWIRYAQWEEEQKDFARARQVFERCLLHHGEKTEFWRHYAEMELRHGFVEEARAIWERAVRAHPGVPELWLKYILLERAAYDDDRAREVFRRWLAMKPAMFAWRLAVEFERDRGNLDRARELLAQFVAEHNQPATWEYYVSFELLQCRDMSRGMQIAQTALQVLGAGLTVTPSSALVVSTNQQVVGAPAAATHYTASSSPNPALDEERRSRQRELLRSIIRISLSMARAYALDPSRVAECRSVYRTLMEQLQLPAVAELYGAGAQLDEGEPTLASHQREVFLSFARFERRQAGGGDTQSTTTTTATTSGPIHSSDLLTLAHAKDAYRKRISEGPSLLLLAKDAPHTTGSASASSLQDVSYYDAVASLLRLYLDEECSLRLSGQHAEAAQKRLEWQELLSEAIVAQGGAATLLNSSAAGAAAATATAVIEAQKCATLALFYANTLLVRPGDESQVSLDSDRRMMGGDAQQRAKAAQLLVAALRKLPVPRAWYPALWIAAAGAQAALSYLSDDHVRAAREIFGAAVANCPCAEVFTAYVKLEQTIGDARRSVMPKYEAEETIPRSRRIFQTWIEHSPLNHEPWLQYSQYEVSSNNTSAALSSLSTDRADAILVKGIQILTSAGRDETNIGSRYERYRAADLLWKQRMTTAIRQNPPNVLKARSVLTDLQQAVWDSYDAEFRQWSTDWTAKEGKKPAPTAAAAAAGGGAAGTAAPIPHHVPHHIFAPALQRLQDAVQGRVLFELQVGRTLTKDLVAAKDLIRKEVFKSLIATKRAEGAESDLAFQERQRLRQWVDLELQPLFAFWRAFEQEHGTEESRLAVQETAEPVKKRTRLFKK